MKTETDVFIKENKIKKETLLINEIAPKRKNLKPKTFFIFVMVVVFSIIAVNKFLTKERIEKKIKEIEQIQQRTIKEKYNTDESCEVYSLRARTNGIYPCYNCGINPTIFLYTGEVWKYGKTCIGEDKRYNNLQEINLIFIREFRGTEQQCLIRVHP